jgi:hypothetical protein
MIGLLKRLTPRSASVLLLFTCIATGAAVLAVLHRDPAQACVSVCFIGMIWLLVRGAARPGGWSLQLDSDAISVSVSGLRYRIRWDEIAAARLVTQSVIQLRLRDTGRLLREMEPQAQRFRLAFALWANRTFHGCDLTLTTALPGLPAEELFKEISSRALVQREPWPVVTPSKHGE